MVSPSSVGCFSDWGGMSVLGNVVLVDATVSFHQCNSECAECGVPIILSRHVLWIIPFVEFVAPLVQTNGVTCFGWMVGFQRSKRAGEIPKWLRRQSTYFVHLRPRIIELWFPCPFFHLRSRWGRWRWHSSVLECGCHQHNSSVFTYDSLMNFIWGGFEVACHAVLVHIEWSWNYFRWFSKFMAFDHTNALNFPSANACGVGALSFQGKLGSVRHNGENPVGDPLLLSGESQSQWAAALNTNLLKFNSRIDMKS